MRTLGREVYVPLITYIGTLIQERVSRRLSAERTRPSNHPSELPARPTSQLSSTEEPL